MVSSDLLLPTTVPHLLPPVNSLSHVRSRATFACTCTYVLDMLLIANTFTEVMLCNCNFAHCKCILAKLLMAYGLTMLNLLCSCV